MPQKPRYTVLLKFNSQKELDRFLNVHLPFEVEIEDHGEPKPKRRQAKKAPPQGKPRPTV